MNWQRRHGAQDSDLTAVVGTGSGASEGADAVVLCSVLFCLVS